MKTKTEHSKGFTIIELLIAMLISSIVIASIYSAFQSNLSSYTTQQRVVGMQQNSRAISFYITRDIMMAGYDPGDVKADAGISDARSGSITLSADLNENDAIDANETITYTVVGTDLTRNGTVLSKNVNILNFVYLDKDGTVLTDSDGDGVVDDMSDIVSIQISVIVQEGDKISQLAQNYTNNKTYYNQQGTVLLDKSAAPDLLRRRLYTAQINCRNLGL
ncbi:MAG: prepilin-type N-terminal cleavage/methylation domain-containing protein [Desulfobacula sp.]|jgi:type IV pilus assembly protein PilW|uniref:PilW family protein n=1 Tax=Desulfobacula sp. TaxID=2593537 RepID=UPI001DF8E25F|nr:prepilin-type N-terminal cleavage/methylation domain-containing protein [Desulfobacula sp.]MBT3484598.1 prepilin-type N-terminal cleavage/methylation domain-containing protein [Desulfobacula sp.]MBT3803968.1 prepilin-type N-terminal cleavage/methylation domain-containing protein [Desulfobacula sp.]MBT4023583.1 prepilin-type N-terminal cleavage/methylation domain-containing protein [Desulfobacula sp.]MBT4197749.1 prepilin-type N-terminal cleavage/methylation domain-containing protein [Desulfo